MKLRENGTFYAVRPQSWNGLVSDLTASHRHKKIHQLRTFVKLFLFLL